MYKGIELLRLNQKGEQEVVNTVYIKNGEIKTSPRNDNYVNEEIDELIQKPLFHQGDEVSKVVDPKKEPELFLDALRHRYNSTFFRFSEIKDISITDS